MKNGFTLLCILISLNLFAQSGANDNTFNPNMGADGHVQTTAIQADGKIIIGGEFTTYNGTPINYIARLNSNGSLDGTFNVGTAADGYIRTIAMQADGKIIIGGGFTSFDGTPINKIARLNTDGSIDGSFNVGTGIDVDILTIAIQTDGKIIIGGSFTSYDGTAINRIARLNDDGSLDGTFNVGTGIDFDVLTIAIQADDKIIIGGWFSNYDGIATNQIARLNNDGSLDVTFNVGTGTDLGILTTAIQSDGKIVIGGDFTSYDGTAINRIARLNSDGTLDGTFNVGTGTNNYLLAITIQDDGQIIIGGLFTSYDGSPINGIARLNSDGSLDANFNPGNGFEGPNVYVNSINIQVDKKIIVGGLFTSYNGIVRNNVVRILNISKGVLGSIFLDSDQNCTKDITESGLYGRRVIINPGNIIAETNSVGEWFVDSLAVGNYIVLVDSTMNWLPSCSQVYSFTISNADEITYATNIGLINTNPCTAPEISIHTPFLRRCFTNQKIYVFANNTYLATGALNNAYCIVELDSLLIPTSATLSYTALGNYKYRFELGNLNPGQFVNFNIDCTVSCDALNLQTLCMEAKLFPAEDCVFDTIPNPFPIDNVLPCNTIWDKSSLSVDGFCNNGNIIFTVTNTGSSVNGNMTCYAPVRIYIDGQFTQLDSVLLAGEQTVTYTFTGDGRTWRLEADQHPLHPGNSHPNSTIELCGDINNWTPNLVNALPQDDANSVNDIFCGQVRGSYDPNDKTGFPLGLGTQHNVLPNGEIEYLIRFQNTGTDTAFTVVIRDTLSPNLDIFSIRSGVSSHDYTFKLYGQRIAEWRFDNILLPDSNVNQAASNGFIKFKIKQAKNLPDGTEIKNSADIYFDYNDPVITNKTLHTINRNLIQPNWDGKRTIATTACLSYTFNSVEYTKSGSYLHRIANTPKDSLITLNLTINNVLPNADVTQNDTELSANLSGANYQWIDCNTNTPIVSETSQNFEATVNGTYALKVTKDACVTTSSCYAITTVAVSENSFANNVLVYPNPSSGTITIEKTEGFENCTLKITAVNGVLVYEKTKIDGAKLAVDLSKEANGIYFIQLIDKNTINNFKIVKN